MRAIVVLSLFASINSAMAQASEDPGRISINYPVQVPQGPPGNPNYQIILPNPNYPNNIPNKPNYPNNPPNRPYYPNIPNLPYYPPNNVPNKPNFPNKIPIRPIYPIHPIYPIYPIYPNYPSYPNVPIKIPNNQISSNNPNNIPNPRY